MRNGWFLACGLLVLAHPRADAQTGGSVTGRAQIIRDLTAEYTRAFEAMRELSTARESYLRRGLGWRSGDGGYGFRTPTVQVFYTDRSAGLTTFGSDGNETTRFVLSYQDRTPWGVYTRPDGTTVTAGYSGTEVVNLQYVFADGSRVDAWGPTVRVTYAGGSHFYGLTYSRGEASLLVSGALTRAIQEGGQGLLRDLAADFPAPYVVRILATAVEAGVALSDDQALARFAVGWLRSLAGVPRVPVSPALQQAAVSHAAYLIQNAVLPRLNTLAATTPNIYLELHNETAGLPGFTGASIRDRTRAAGFRDTVTETANFGTPWSVADMAGWFHTVYHRRPFLDPTAVGFGYARGVSTERPGEAVAIANWGFGGAAAAPLAIYPRDGETLVPVGWAAFEAPNPFPGRRTGTGTPISVIIGDRALGGGTIELLDAGGAPVPLAPIEVRQDPDRYLETAPQSPLLPGTKYTIRYTHRRGVVTSTFTTAPLSPAESLLARMRVAAAGDPETRNPGFDVEAALEAGLAKGVLSTVQAEGRERVVDAKYGLSLSLPEGWALVARTWQEIALAQGNKSIAFQFLPLGPGADARTVLTACARSITYTAEQTTPVDTGAVAGFRRVYTWPHAGKVILYGLTFGEVGVGVFGYGVTPELMDTLVASLRAP